MHGDEFLSAKNINLTNVCESDAVLAIKRLGDMALPGGGMELIVGMDGRITWQHFDDHFAHDRVMIEFDPINKQLDITIPTDISVKVSKVSHL